MKTLQRTLSIVKPDAVEKNADGDIVKQLEQNGFRIVGMKMLHINKAQAKEVLRRRLAAAVLWGADQFMSSGPIVVMALEKENAIADYRAG